MRRSLLIPFLLLPTLSVAQNVETMEFQSQPLMYMKEGNVQGCGVRLVGVRPPPAISSEKANWQVIDVSFNLSLPGMATIKLSSYDSTPSELKANVKPRMVYVERGWLKAPSAVGTNPMPGTNYFRGEDPNAVLYVTSVDSVLSLFKAQAENQTIHIGIRRKGENFERIFAGKLTFNETDASQSSQCFSDLISRL